MTRVVGVSGSLRAGSYNTALLRAAAAASPDGLEIEVCRITGIPLYDGDVEAAEGIPRAVEALKEKIRLADGWILATPEYNHSIPGVLKNAIDWLSRPGKEIPLVFGGKPVALMGASPGRFGTAFSQRAWLPVLRRLGTRPWFGATLYVPSARTAFNESGELIDGDVRERLAEFLSGFLGFIRG